VWVDASGTSEFLNNPQQRHTQNVSDLYPAWRYQLLAMRSR